MGTYDQTAHPTPMVPRVCMPLALPQPLMSILGPKLGWKQVKGLKKGIFFWYH